MAGREHRYLVEVRWTGNQGVGTASYRSYSRDHDISSPATPDKAMIAGSADPAFRGDPNRWNPEELFVAAISACHKLWYLNLCAGAGIVVTDYRDVAEGVMVQNQDGSGQFASVTLRPQITVTRATDLAKARELHRDAHTKCFIANSINTPVAVEPVISSSDQQGR